MPTMTGDWNHNSYILDPTKEQLDAPTVIVPPPTIAPPPIPVNATKWAKGTFKIEAGSTSKGKLSFVPGLELVVDFSLETSNGQTVFRAQGVGEAGPLKGLVYDLLGWASLDNGGEVTEVAGGILAVKAGALPPPNNGLNGQEVGAVGYFKLSK